jgi:hypothetical protein
MCPIVALAPSKVVRNCRRTPWGTALFSSMAKTALLSMFLILSGAFRTWASDPEVLFGLSTDQGVALGKTLQMRVKFTQLDRAFASATISVTDVSKHDSTHKFVATEQVRIPAQEFATRGRVPALNIPIVVSENGRYRITLSADIVARDGSHILQTAEIYIIADTGKVFSGTAEFHGAAFVMAMVKRGFAKNEAQAVTREIRLKEPQLKTVGDDVTRWLRGNGFVAFQLPSL